MPETRHLLGRCAARHRVVDDEAIQARRPGGAEVGREQRSCADRPIASSVEDGGEVATLVADHEIIDPVTVDVARVRYRRGAGHAGDDHVGVGHQVQLARPGRRPAEQDVHAFLVHRRGGTGQPRDRHREIVSPIVVVVPGSGDDRAAITARGQDEPRDLQRGSRVVHDEIARRRPADVQIRHALLRRHVLADGGDEIGPHGRGGRHVADEVTERNHRRLVGETDRADGERVLVVCGHIDRLADQVVEMQRVPARRRLGSAGSRRRHRIEHVQEVVGRHPLEKLHRLERDGRAGVRVSSGEQEKMPGGVKQMTDGISGEMHVDHRLGQQRRARRPELLQRLRRLQDVPVARISQVERQAVDGLSGDDRGEMPRELHRVVDLLGVVPGRVGREERTVVPGVHTAVGHELESVGRRRAAVGGRQGSIADQ